MGVGGDTSNVCFTAVVVSLAVATADRGIKLGADNLWGLIWGNGGSYWLGSFAAKLGLNGGKEDDAGDEDN